MLHGKRWRTRGMLRFLSFSVVRQKDKRDKEERWVYREVGRKSQSKHCVGAISVDSIGYAVKDTGSREYIGRPAQTRRDSKRIEQKPVSR